MGVTELVTWSASDAALPAATRTAAAAGVKVKSTVLVVAAIFSESELCRAVCAAALIPAAAAARWTEARAAYGQAVSLGETLNIRDLAAEGHAGLANVAIGTGDSARALAHAEVVLAILAEGPRVGLDEPFLTYLACYRVLAAAHDGRACDILGQGHARLVEYAGHIEDEALRECFWENVAEHRELRQLYGQHN